ncbi:hypothetical protein SPRG_03737 [Saprolegnia parasitica CBS 223.65]|uniref:Uncharacterized protein n=1 Tax=Saprolegnia parasitica (strain CBS 223.65) TaxID=695850 RepID=A0A067CYD9_SAPPC|nr:hypothetical protein SPRG_03737 [Saprolegnia parasitica CBS 223.65]KDO31817.1 hypothetical protein SPRG_03737 [Saprolegnia parasitica CBS 223.65]|eukprot:XP_012197697.1 hypothetical protein SPRG_03737 [Saprolegnia parasitica CBS 223.65]
MSPMSSNNRSYNMTDTSDVVGPLWQAQRVSSFQNLTRSLDRRKPTMRVLWVAAALMHAMAGAFLGGMAYAHLYLTHPSLGYDYVTVLHLYRPVLTTVATFGALASLHGLRLLHMLLRALKPSRRVAPSSKSSTSRNSETGLHHVVRLGWRHLRLVGVHGPYFEVKVAFRHLLVSSTNTYRAYRTALLVGDPAINTTVSVILCLYGLCLPLLWISTQRTSKASRRLWTSLVHVVLNFGMNILLPTWVLAPYADFFTRPDALALQYQDTYYPVGIAICQTVLITSLLDYGLMLFTQLFLFSALYDFVACFCSRRRLTATELVADEANLREALNVVRRRLLSVRYSAKRRLVPGHKMGFFKRPATAIVPFDVTTAIFRKSTRKHSSRMTLCVGYSILAGYLLTIVWGLAILGLNFVPWYEVDCPRSCLAQTRPWFTRTCACLALEATCDPASHALDLDFAVVSPTSVVFLIISHCPQLKIPAKVSSIVNLVGLLIYNSTLTTWPEDVTVTHFQRTNMTTLPLGLLTAPSSSFIDLEVSHSNLRDLGLAVSHLETLSVVYLEHCAFSEYPMELVAHASMSGFSLMHNRLTSIPDNVSYPALMYLGVSGNPTLGHLPDAVVSQSSLGEVSLEATNVTTLPPPTSFGPSLGVLAMSGTPYCLLMSENASDDSIVVCDVGDYVDGYFPFAQIVAQRAATYNLLFDDEME